MRCEVSEKVLIYSSNKQRNRTLCRRWYQAIKYRHIKNYKSPPSTLLILFGYKVKYWFFNKFGKKYLDQRHLGDYNIVSRRGWLFLGKVYWYDKEYE